MEFVCLRVCERARDPVYIRAMAGRPPVHINIWDFPGTLEALLRPPFSPGLSGIFLDVWREELQKNSFAREIGKEECSR